MKEENSELVHWENYRIKGYDVDVKKRASIPALIQMMQDTAMEHVLRIGLSAFELEAHELGWVLVRQRLDVMERPPLGASIQVRTIPTGRDKILAYRDFYMTDAEGRLLATMSTAWLLMNIRTRRVAGFPDFILAWLDKTMDAEHLDRPRMAWTNEGARIVGNKMFRVDWFSMDFNRHLTNYYYQRWMLEVLPAEVLEHHTLQAYEIQFKGECHLNDTLQVFVASAGSGEYVHWVRKGDKDLAVAWSKWKEEPNQ
ncbi:MAG: acyl-[acyl-carrier-protein] thioesterase [Haliscomenobacter sp.]